MGKRPKCEHENNVLKMSGCAQCVVTAMEAFNFCRELQCTPRELIRVLHKHYRTVGELQDAINGVSDAPTGVPRRGHGVCGHCWDWDDAAKGGA